MQNFSLHTHTIEFDGRNSVAEMIEQAKRIGFLSIGISNHFIVHPKIKQTSMYAAAFSPKKPSAKRYHQMYSENFDEAIEKMLPIFEQIDSYKSDFPIFKGLEVDFFQYSGWDKGFEKALKILKPDYVIGSCHFSINHDKPINMHDILRFSAEEQEQIVHQYWQNEQNAIKSGYFDFMAHIDLYKRQGIGLDKKFLPLEEKTVALLSDYNLPAEINTASLNKTSYKEDYFLQLLYLFSQFNIKTFFSDDAHHISQLSNGYEFAEKYTYQAGISNFYHPISRNNRFQLVGQNLQKTKE